MNLNIPEFIRNPNPEIFLDENYLVLDFETTAIEYGSPHNAANRILLACWTYKGRSYACRAGENGQNLLLSHIRQSKFIIAHNAKFELGWLKRCGLDLRSVIVWDTMLAEWVFSGNLRPGFSLGAVAERRLGGASKDIVGDWIRAGVDPQNIPINWLEEYCHQDVRLTLQVFRSQLDEALERKQLHLVYQRGLVCACLADIEFNGLHLDKKAVNEEYESVLSQYIEAKKELDDFKADDGSLINWRSPKQVAELLYDKLKFKEPTDFRGNPLRTPSGGRRVDKEAIAKLAPKTVKQTRLVELLKKVANLNAKLVKSLEFFKGVCDRYDATFYGQFNQGTTQTHRLSSSGRPVVLPYTDIDGQDTVEKSRSLQFQNIPREYKRLFIPKQEGYVNVECDGAQLEFRVAAELGNDEVAKTEIANGVDIHSITARTLTEAGEPTDRQSAKSRSFRPLFGGSSGTEAEQAYCKFFQRKYKSIFETQTSWTHSVLKTGKLRTAYGLEFFWPNTRMSRSGFITNTTNIFNYPIQGMATGEMIPLILVLVWHAIRDLRAEITCTVHDSILLEVHPEDLNEIKDILVDCFTKQIYGTFEALYGLKLSVVYGAEIKAGREWGKGTLFSEKFEASL